MHGAGTVTFAAIGQGDSSKGRGEADERDDWGRLARGIAARVPVGDGARTRAVRQCLARPGDWLNPPPDAFALPWRYQPHLPRIAYWYARGESIATIEANVGGALSAWAEDRCIAVACARIAARLNHDPAAYGLAR